MRASFFAPLGVAALALAVPKEAAAVIDNGALQCETNTPTYYPRGDHWAVVPDATPADGPEPIFFYQQKDGPIPMSGEAAMPSATPAVCAVYRAFATWMNHECTPGVYPNILILDDGDYDTRDRGDVWSGQQLTSYKNIVYWVEPGGAWEADSLTVALTTNLYYVDTGIIVTSDMEFNGQNYQWRTKAVTTNCGAGTATVGCSTSNNKCFDIETVALHEAGHFMGFNHVTCANAVMFPNGSGTATNIVLSLHEQTAICKLYPPRPAVSTSRAFSERCTSDSECPNAKCVKPQGMASTSWGWCSKPCSCTDGCTNNCPQAYECIKVNTNGSTSACGGASSCFCKPGVHLTGGASTGGCTCNTQTGSCQTGCACDGDCSTCACNTSSSSCQSNCSCDPQCTAACTCNTTPGACNASCACDPDCTTCACNTTTSLCENSCPCDPQCASACSCDTTWRCDANCTSCDPECASCACDVSFDCTASCACDQDCEASCACDLSWACDANCMGCDPECETCACNTTATICQDGCTCDPDCESGGGGSTDPGGFPADLCAPCTSGPDCSSGLCVGDGTVTLCTMGCFGGISGPDGGNNAGCPTGFLCLGTDGGDSICWPETLATCTGGGNDNRADLHDICYRENTSAPDDDWFKDCGPDLVCFGFIPRCGGQEGACIRYCNETDRPCPDQNQTCCYGVDDNGNCEGPDPGTGRVHGGCFDLRKEGESCVAADESICGSGLGCFAFNGAASAKCYQRCETNTCSTGEDCGAFTDLCNNAFDLCCDSSNQQDCLPGPVAAGGALSLGFACNDNTDCESQVCLPRAGRSACSRTCNTTTHTGCPGDDYDIDGDGLGDGGFDCIAGPAGVTGYCWPTLGPKGTPAPIDEPEPPPFVKPPEGCDCNAGPGSAAYALLALLLRRRRAGARRATGQ